MPGQSIQRIAIADIVSGTQLREHFDEERLTELTQSMRESGQREAIHVAALGGGKYELIAGSRRLRAGRRANWTTIEARVHEDLRTKSDVLLQQMLLDMQREELTPLEQAKAVSLLKKETGWNSSQIASRLGFSNGMVTKLLSILDLSPDLQDRIRCGQLPVTAAYELARVADPAQQAELASRIASGELKRDDLIGDKKKLASRAHRSGSRRRIVRVTAKLDGRQTVSVSAPHLDLAGFIDVLDKLLARARPARDEGLTLQTFLKRLVAERHNNPAAKEVNFDQPVRELATS